ncbi:MAG: asparaginase [Candidatus Lutibacillus vidarii]
MTGIPRDDQPTSPSEVSPALTEAAVVAHVLRSGTVESVHRGSVVVTGPDGEVEWSLGGADGYVFPRSSLKPVQAVAMVENGLSLSPELLALVCASHSGEERHLAGVRRILAGAGLGESDLQNTPDYPYDETARHAVIRAGGSRMSITQNCSGKHSGMLATCQANGWPTDSYREPSHALQRAITAVVERMCGPVDALAVDGCGAPVHHVSLTGLARAFGALALAPAGSARARVAEAMASYPEMVGGKGRGVTAVMSASPGLVAKDGAESVYAVGLPDGRGVAVKIADGYPRAAPVVCAQVLRRLGVDESALRELEAAPILGHGTVVGAVVAAF